MRWAAAVLAACLSPVLLPAVPALARQAERIPTIGQEGPELDACGGIGTVTRLALGETQNLAVRDRPADEGYKKDELAAKTLVWLCDAEGEWQGIVYPGGEYQDLGDCRVSSPVPQPAPYQGPCRHGWVDARFIDLVAG